MGAKANAVRKQVVRKIRSNKMSQQEVETIKKAKYMGSPFHKKAPGNFGLPTPPKPLPHKTLCDEAGLFDKSTALDLLLTGIERQMVSEVKSSDGFPKQIWAIDETGRVYEAMYSNNKTYHGYPLRRSDPFCEKVRNAW